MSALMPHEVRRAQLNRPQGRTLLALRMLSGDDYEWASVKQVAAALGTSVPNARANLRWLEVNGYIDAQLVTGGFLEYRER